MKIKPVFLRERAHLDIEDAAAYYLGESDMATLGLINALEKACTHIGRHPDTGSPRYAHELNLPGLRS